MRNFILIMVIALLPSKLWASHMMGCDLSYEYLSAYKYKITAKIYRDCSGIPFNAPGFKALCSNGSNAVNINYTRTAINDVSTYCSKDSSPCQPVNTPSRYGIEQHVYEAIVDFNIAPFNAIKNAGCCEVKIAVEQCCRNGDITTIMPGNFYTEAMINICKSAGTQNSSPVFNSFPVQYVCCNQLLSYSQGISDDSNADSLSFELVAPLNANNSNESYMGNFTPQKPMTVLSGSLGFNFNTSTGFLLMTPTNCSEVGVVVVQASEWKRDTAGVMQKIGYTRREMQLLVQDCGFNNPPYFTGNNKFSICEGDKLCFSVVSKDDPFLPKQTSGDTVSLSLVNNSTGATMTIKDSTAREKEAEVCWQTRSGDGRSLPYSMTIVLRDDYCPSPQLAYRDYSILVKPRPKGKRLYTRLLKGQLRMESLPTDTLYNNYNYQFNIYDSLGGSNPFTIFNQRIDTFQFQIPGKYYIEHYIVDKVLGCPTRSIDTIYITSEHITAINGLMAMPISFSPNPGNGIFKILGDDLIEEGSSLNVFSADGKLAMRVAVHAQTIDISSLSDGVYTVEIQFVNGIYRSTLVLRR